MIWIGFIVLGFVSGSIPFALLIGRAKGVDIRRHGSGNVGATNVSRVLGRPYGLLCFALDAAKGAGPVVAAGLVQGVFGATVAAVEPTAQWAWLAVAVASVAGHMFSPFVGFRGGKGVATGFGSMVAMWNILTIPLLLALAAWLCVLAVSRYISLASIVAAQVVPIAFMTIMLVRDGGDDPNARVVHAMPVLIVTIGIAALVVLRHRANIARLQRGEEPRIGQGRRAGGA
ncbi:MAG: glycerol-3-phosphate 1-O-acyltransferase PlsY [Phycisphaerales bacterium]|nr:glycerol-3-phosphate 1-O-acyltransferase PlsY [Phycisphaerales bacterium]